MKIFRDYRYGRIEQGDDINEYQDNARNSLRDSLIGSGDASNCDIVLYYLKQALMTLTALIKSISLRHSVVSKNFIIASSIYMVFVFLDIVRFQLSQSFVDIHWNSLRTRDFKPNLTPNLLSVLSICQRHIPTFGCPFYHDV